MPGRATNDPSNYIAVGKQSAKDTEATTFYFLKHLDGSGFDVDETIETVREGGDGQEAGFFYKSAISADGDLVQSARPEGFGRAAAYALGADSVAAGTGTATGLSIHTAIPTSTLPYLTVEQLWADVDERVSNVQLSSLVIEGEAGRPLKITNSMVAGGTPYRRNAAASALTPTRESIQPFFYPGGSYQLTNASGAKLTKFKSETQRNLDTDIRTVQLFREDVVALNFDTSVEGTLKYEDSSLYDLVHYLGGTTIDPNALGLSTGMFQAFTQFGTGTNARFLEVTHPLVVITGAKVNKLDPDGKTMYIDFSAMGGPGPTSAIYTRVQTASSAAF
jgi:hypothetical protein